MNLSSTRTIIWATPPAEGANEIEEHRFTFASSTMAGSGVYWRSMRDFEAWYEEQFGHSNQSDRESKDDGARAEGWRMYNAGNDYAAIVASLRKLEQRTRSLNINGANNEPYTSEWQEIAIPEEWNTFAGFTESMPWSCILALAEAAHGTNPGLWRFQDGEVAKKNGGVNVA